MSKNRKWSTVRCNFAKRRERRIVAIQRAARFSRDTGNDRDFLECARLPRITWRSVRTYHHNATVVSTTGRGRGVGERGAMCTRPLALPSQIHRRTLAASRKNGDEGVKELATILLDVVPLAEEPILFDPARIVFASIYGNDDQLQSLARELCSSDFFCFFLLRRPLGQSWFEMRNFKNLSGDFFWRKCMVYF